MKVLTFALSPSLSLCGRILQKPGLAGHIDVDVLGKLLPEDQLQPLEEQFLNKQQVKTIC